MNKPTILIAEDDKTLTQTVKGGLGGYGFEVLEVSGRSGILQTFRSCNPDLIIIVGGVENQEWDGLSAAEEIRLWNPKVPIILVAGHSSLGPNPEADMVGVSAYLKSPFSCRELVGIVIRNLFTHRSDRCSAEYGKDIETGFARLRNGHRMVGESPAMREIKEYLTKVAPTDSTVLVTGETGTGKELAAELIHSNSPRQKGPFISINCAALPESLLESELFGYEKGAFTGAVSSRKGKFERAEGGIIFLDEIGDMSPYAQAKILRVIESREIYPLGGKRGIPLNVRFIAATNREPEQLVTEGRFRTDLYYRINVARVHLPPLRERKEDIPLLLNHYLQVYNKTFGREVESFTEEALRSLLQYRWAGNVRELKNLVESTFVNLSSSKVGFSDLPKTFQRVLKEAATLPENERDRMISALFATKWNKSKAAQKLNWSRMTLYRKMAKYHITKPQR